MTLPFTAPIDDEIHDLENGTPKAARVAFWDIAEPDGRQPLDFSIEGPDYVKHPWDLLWLNGIRVPGISEVKCTPTLRLKTNKTVGNDGGPTIEEGHEAAKVDINIKIWTESQWSLLQDLMRDLWRRPGTPVPAGDKKAITISHPACDLWGVTSILIRSPSSPEPAAEVGARIVRIQAVQYIAPKERPVTKPIKGEHGTLAPSAKDPKGTKVTMPSETIVAKPPA